MKNKINIVRYVILLFFILALIRFSGLQLFSGEGLSKAATAQRILFTVIDRPRGSILDKNGISLTSAGQKAFAVIQPWLVNTGANAVQSDLLIEICDILRLDCANVASSIASSKSPPVFEVGMEEAEELRRVNPDNIIDKGVSIIQINGRYDGNSLARHLTGYLNDSDDSGASGIEKSYNEELSSGMALAAVSYTDARKTPLTGLGYGILTLHEGKPHDYAGQPPAYNVKTTIDIQIQKIVEEVMARHNVTGAVVVENVLDGSIAALASKPDFDQNRISQYLGSPGMELFNRAVASYNLGSIFKIIDVAAMTDAVIAGDFDPEGMDLDNYLCSGSIRVGSNIFKCSSHQTGGHGLIDLEKGFALSCNPYFINASIQTGYRKLVKMAADFGLGAETGIRSQNLEESSGLLPPADAYYSNGDIANLSIGQGTIMATPVQVANIAATIANGGIKNRVNIIDSIVDQNGKKIRNLRVNSWKRIMPLSTARLIGGLMRGVMTSGTGEGFDIEQYGGACGKTGSAETGQYKDGKMVVHAWFAGYFPAKQPKYSIAVFVENGRNGRTASAPVFSEIASEIMKKGL